MIDPDLKHGSDPVGHAWLRREFGLAVLPPPVASFVISGARRTEVRDRRTLEFYPRPYATDGSAVANIRFALRYEAIDLGCLIGALKAMKRSDLEGWIRSEPTGAYSRRAWFFCEVLAGLELDIDDARMGQYVDALDPGKHVVAPKRRSSRHRVNDNLLGGPGLCPTVRRTDRLTSQIGARVDEEARRLMARYDPIVLTRAVNYLYTKETRSSFAIEGETPSTRRAERFIDALKSAPRFQLDKTSLVALQGDIVDPRYAARDWRDVQNFVGETVGYREEVHYVCPRPGDVPFLMDGWMSMSERLMTVDVDPVVAAAVLAFSFVFVHPFEDGNGRIHRFLMHHVLAKRGYGPPGTIFPVSAAILRDRRSYDDVLETFSKPITALVDWHLTPDQDLEVSGSTLDHYRYFDATAFAEYLYDRVADTVRRDLREELGFVAVFDGAFTAVREVVDMPDRRASLLIRLCLQNGGRLSKQRRASFAEITDGEMEAIEAAIRGAMAAEAGRADV